MEIRVSHETPISILPDSFSYNDYCYALVHLFETHPTYYSQFEMALNEGRDVYLDNRIFELGESFDMNRYEYWINKLKPTLYIVPDVLESRYETIEKHKQWTDQNTIKHDCLQMGVVQGETWTDLVKCYNYMSDNVDVIAISFDYSYYITTGYGNNKLTLFSTGRQRFIQQLIQEGIWNWSKPHHLLGCSLAKEFSYYIDDNIYNIKSIDTSNPIIAGLHGYRYMSDQGLRHKPKTLLADMIDATVSDDQLEDIKYNTNKFKQIIGR